MRNWIGASALLLISIKWVWKELKNLPPTSSFLFYLPSPKRQKSSLTQPYSISSLRTPQTSPSTNRPSKSWELRAFSSIMSTSSANLPATTSRLPLASTRSTQTRTRYPRSPAFTAVWPVRQQPIAWKWSSVAPTSNLPLVGTASGSRLTSDGWSATTTVPPSTTSRTASTF